MANAIDKCMYMGDKMKILLLISLALYFTACGKNSGGSAGKCSGILSGDVIQEAISSDNSDLRILVLGHVYDVMQSPDSTQDAFVDFVNAQHADIVVFGGDSLFGAQDAESFKTLEQQWDQFEAMKARIDAKTIMVSGNHDGCSYKEEYQELSFKEFTRRNKINYSIKATIRGRNIGLHFIYTGDFKLPVERFNPIATTFSSYDENFVFGGHRVNSENVLKTLNSSEIRFKYFSGDYEENNRVINLAHVEAHNVTSVCAAGFDADLINIGTETTVTQLGHCFR